nr:DUF6119 family protein [Lysobacter sp. Root983]
MLRRGRAIASAFTEKYRDGVANPLAARPWPGVEGGELYFGQIYSSSPKWLDFIRGGVPLIGEDLFTGGAGAAIFIPVDGRVYAACFGHIHMALDDDAFERGFGLRVVLNCVPRSNLRTLDLATPDAVTFQKRVQASRDSDLQEFGVDMLRDLARVAGGTPSDAGFAKFVAGKDSLSLTCSVDARSIVNKCAEVGRTYRRQEYKKEFAWVDNLKVVAERDLQARLDAKLFNEIEAIRRGEESDLHMAPPEIVSYNEGGVLHYNGFGSHGVDYHSLSIEDYVYELNDAGFDGAMDDVKRLHRISARSPEGGGFSEKWRVYDCFVLETTLGAGASAKTYIIFAGDWYCVERSFKRRVEEFFNSIERVDIVGKTSCVNEKELIDDLNSNRRDLLKLDQVKINPEGTAHAFIEPCDFLSERGDFIHLKDGHSSGPISHLWSQGLVSTDALISDGVYRQKLKQKASGRFRALLPGRRDAIVRSKYRVVFGIMRKRYVSGGLDLPFFSKVSFQSTAEKIQKLGIKVAIELIEKPASESGEDEE